MSVLSNTGILAGASGAGGASGDGWESSPVVANSLRFNDDDTAYLNKTFSQGNQQTWTYSCWVKRASFGVTKFGIFGRSNNDANIIFSDDSGGNVIRFVYPNANISKWSKNVYRDPLAWYHIVCTLDTNNGTQEDRLRFYINGERVTDWHTNTLTDLTQGVMLGINSANAHEIGRFNGGSYFDGLISDINFVDGTALDPTSFGETDATAGQWVPKEYDGDYNIFYQATTTSAATGALPILNTTGDYGTVLGSGIASDSESSDLEACWPMGTSGGLVLNDQSPTGRTSSARNITNGGSIASNTSKSKFYGGSAYFTGGATGSFSTDVWNAIGSGEYTIEFWIYLDSTSMSAGHGNTVLSSRNAGDNGTGWMSISFSGMTGNIPQLVMNLSGGPTHYITDDGLSGAFPVGEWVHCAQTKDSSNVVRTFKNGAKVAETTGTQALDNVARGLLGGQDYGSYASWVDFYLQDVRIYTEAKYTADFTPTGIVETGQNSFHLKFDNTSDLGEDSSGNDNDWTANNLTATSNEVTVSTATGGLPFYNTTGDYGGTKGSGYRTDSDAGTTGGTGLVLALPGDVLTDEHDHVNTGSSAHTITVNGSGTVTSTTKSKFYGTSIYFDGVSGEHLDTDTSTDFELGSGDWTFEAWVYMVSHATNTFLRADTGGTTTGDGCLWYHGSNTYIADSGGTSWGTTVAHSALPSIGQWHHVALVRDGGTVSNYLDGTLDGSASISGSIYQTTNGLKIGGYGTGGYKGYMQDFRYYKGVAKYTSDFIVPTRQTNFADIDVLADSPSTYDDEGNGAGNYATLNPLNSSSNQTLSDGNLKCTNPNTTWGACASTIGMTDGKYYFECTAGGSEYTYVGIANASSTIWEINGYFGGTSNDWGYLTSSGDLRHNTGNLDTGGDTVGVGDVIGVAFNTSNKESKWYVNGVLQYTETLSGDLPFFFGSGSYTSSNTVNFGQRPFDNLPTGYKALNTFNLDDPLIDDPSLYFDTKVYAGSGGSRAITMDNATMSPDFVWIKSRSSTNGHNMYDVVRGANKYLSSHLQTAEGTATNELMSFDSNGFTLAGAAGVNDTGKNYVAWAWDAGSEDAETNDAGSIESEVKANPSAGFSIVSYEGTGSSATVGHGLNAAPNFIIIKNREGSYSWAVGHDSIGWTKYLYLNEHQAVASSSAPWNDSAPTTSVFNVAGSSATNKSTYEMIAYCWSEVEGFSKFGSYEGSSDLPFVYCGFKPAFVMTKAYDAAYSWRIYDADRDPCNQAGLELYPDDNAIEYDGFGIDFLSNGFKLRNTSYPNNAGTNYIFCAFAESPFKYSNAN